MVKRSVASRMEKGERKALSSRVSSAKLSGCLRTTCKSTLHASLRAWTLSNGHRGGDNAFCPNISHSRLSFQTVRYSGPINVRLGGRQREDVVKCARERRPSRNCRSSTRRGRLVVVWVLSLLRTCGHLCAAKRRGNWPSNRSRIARGNSERKA